MKTLKIFFLLLVVYSVKLTAQNNIVALRDNPIFKEFVSKNFELVKLLKKSIGNDLSKLNSVQKSLAAIQNNNTLSNDEQFKSISEIFNISDIGLLKSYYNTISKDINILKNEYSSSFTQQILTEEVKAVINTSISTNNPTGPPSPGGEGGGCRDQAAYTACSVVCATTAAIGYAGCLGTVFGAPLCWALVVAAQTACIYLCSVDYCQPS